MNFAYACQQYFFVKIVSEMSIISVSNSKGGDGKATLVANLADPGKRMLLSMPTFRPPCPLITLSPVKQRTAFGFA